MAKKRRNRSQKLNWRQIVFYGITLLLALSMVLSTILIALK